VLKRQGRSEKLVKRIGYLGLCCVLYAFFTSCALPNFDEVGGGGGSDADSGFTLEGDREVTLVWDPNTEPDLKAYRIYFGYASGDYTYCIDVGNQTTYTITGLASDKEYYFAATAYNLFGQESAYSNEVVLPSSL
jgi:hypothetical protein